MSINVLELVKDSLIKISKNIPDNRLKNKMEYSIQDILLGAYSVFHMQEPSFLSHQKLMLENTGKSNALSIFGIQKIASDTHFRRILDLVSSDYLIPAYQELLTWFKDKEEFKSLKSFQNTYLVPLDGTQFFSSNTINCPNCLTKKHKDGTTTYSHEAITPAIVCPNKSFIFPLQQEFISNKDGNDKQDCENAAAKRFLQKYGPQLSELNITILGDDLYARQPICEEILKQKMHFILTIKPGAHPYLSEWINTADPKKDLNEFEITKWDGKEKLRYIYRYMNKCPLRNTADSILVNYAELTIVNKNGKEIKHFSYITDFEITRENAIELVEAGRCRWKIENENNNTLKTKGYHIEHNFGHGNVNLSNFLLSLNILAFLCHNLMEIFDKRYIILREKLSRRRKFFTDIIALTTYMYFDNWSSLLKFMLAGLEIPDPGG